MGANRQQGKDAMSRAHLLLAAQHTSGRTCRVLPLLQEERARRTAAPTHRAQLKVIKALKSSVRSGR